MYLVGKWEKHVIKKKIKGGPVVLLTLNLVQDRSKLPPSVQIFSSEKKWL